MTDKQAIKRRDMEALARYRERLCRQPRLVYLFVELTDRCNLRCVHCGSRCGAENARFLDPAQLIRTLQTAAEDFPPQSVMICLTGGEPMLHPAFYEIAAAIDGLGMPWGMTTNGTCIDASAAARLRALHMGSVTLSLDGLEPTHDRFRGVPGNFRRTLEAVRALRAAGHAVQVTTVVHGENFPELAQIHALLRREGVNAWRLVGLEPIGRALEHPELMLTPAQMRAVLDFIREKRFDAGETMDVCFGCSHFLGWSYEREVRDYYFLCGAGLYVAGIGCDGDIAACLDIERRPELTQGNIFRDRLSTVWFERFQAFRADRTALCQRCAGCGERAFCRGDSTHTWDFDRNEPRFCIKDVLGGGTDV